MKVIHQPRRKVGESLTQTAGLNLPLFLTNRGLFPLLRLLLQSERRAICGRGACWEEQIVRREGMKERRRKREWEWERWKEGNDRGGGGVVKEKKEIWREIRRMEGKEKTKGGKSIKRDDRRGEERRR